MRVPLLALGFAALMLPCAQTCAAAGWQLADICESVGQTSGAIHFNNDWKDDMGLRRRCHLRKPSSFEFRRLRVQLDFFEVTQCITCL